MGVAHREGVVTEILTHVKTKCFGHIYIRVESLKALNRSYHLKSFDFRIFMCIRNRGVVHGQGVVAES